MAGVAPEQTWHNVTKLCRPRHTKVTIKWQIEFFTENDLIKGNRKVVVMQKCKHQNVTAIQLCTIVVYNCTDKGAILFASS